MTDPKKLFYRQSGPPYVKNGETITPRVLMHFCVHPGCDLWGEYLYGARWKDGVPGTAYCKAHRPDNGIETSSAHPAPATQEKPDEQSDGNPTEPAGTGPSDRG